MIIKNLALAICLLPTLLAAQQYADCVRAMEICKKSTYNIAKTGGEGSDTKEADFVPCFMGSDRLGMAEENSTWIKWEVKTGGSLTFVITPQRMGDDIDFVVYKLPADGSCQNKKIVRCMAAGDPEDEALFSPCLGKTGLRDGERASSRDPGCNDEGDNTWLAPLKVADGEKYVLLVSNVTEPGPGFSISFGGTATLACEEPPKPKKKEEPKPVEKPKKKEEPTPPVAATPETQKPEEIGGRKVEIGETVQVTNRKLKIKIWDSQIEDGDICSIFIDEKLVVEKVRVTLKPKEFEIELPAGKKEVYLTVFADDFGLAEPNSAKVSIWDGKNEQTIDLVAGRSKQESVKIILN